jgi:methylenetetrahydrofolate reductase (NADPH)
MSFEVFPPKKEADVPGLRDVLRQLAGLKPDFISVTHGAGGTGATGKTADAASFIQNECGITALAHLTCAGSSKASIMEALEHLKSIGMRNILALRGDAFGSAPDYTYASQLIEDIKGFGGFCIGAACYPEGHVDCESLDGDICNLRLKQEAGADFLITQLFFDNAVFFAFLEKIRAAGVTLPVSAGVMPILSRAQVEKMIYMCGASLPSVIVKLLGKYADDPESLRAAGIERAAEQVLDLIRGGAEGVHIYTMNKPEIAKRASEGIYRRARNSEPGVL